MYGVMGAPFAPTDINWTTFAEEASTLMASNGGFYNNVTVTATANGYSIQVPAFGFENNSVAIDIVVEFDSDQVLSFYEFRYGGAILATSTQIEPIDSVITDSTGDLTIEEGYTGVVLSWTATHSFPDTYTIDLLGTGQVVSPTAWTSGVQVNYNIPTGFTEGNYTYIITFTDDYGGSASDSITITVEAVAESATPIPGFELSIVIGVVAITIIGLILKKKNA
jgi:hypothetical protein